MKKIIVILTSVVVLITTGSLNNLNACKSGGPGAADCQDSGTVMKNGEPYSYYSGICCREGFYACCNVDGAHCIASSNSQKNKSFQNNN